MTVRDEVLNLVDQLSPDDLVTARRMLRGLISTPGVRADVLQAALLDCPEEDEEIGQDEEAAVKRAWEDYRAGRGMGCLGFPRARQAPAWRSG